MAPSAATHMACHRAMPMCAGPRLDRGRRDPKSGRRDRTESSMPSWKLKLVKELKGAGFNIDANKVI